VNIVVQLEPSEGLTPPVVYRWDSDTDILTARLDTPAEGGGPSASLEIEAPDGSWLIVDVVKGRIAGVEVAVWPEVHVSPSLVPPVVGADAYVARPDGVSDNGAVVMEMEAALQAESDEAERVIHFRIGIKREVRPVRLGRDMLLELDTQSRIAGLWLLNVPPLPST
jgi:hypothetical protein